MKWKGQLRQDVGLFSSNFYSNFYCKILRVQGCIVLQLCNTGVFPEMLMYYIYIITWQSICQYQSSLLAMWPCKIDHSALKKNFLCQVRALECPICLETAAPPVSQCVHGHILCVTCRPKMTRCPVCRVQLAQGRCLLADNLHRVLRETYFDANNSQTAEKSVASVRRSLCDQLFSKNKKQEETLAVTSSRSISKPKQFLLTRLLLGGKEKAASADNLTRLSEIGEEAAAVSHRTGQLVDNLLRLSVIDRAKSASTGELSRDNLRSQRIDSTMSSSQIAGSSRESYIKPTASQQSWSSLQMPIFGGSTDSVSYTQLLCPRLRFCNEVVNYHSLLEHIKSHQVPQVHFYSRNATIPLPIPFGRDVFYILHHDGYMFFFQVRPHSHFLWNGFILNENPWS